MIVFTSGKNENSAGGVSLGEVLQSRRPCRHSRQREGQRALYLALLTAAEDLRTAIRCRRGHIFVFTGGKNSTGSVSLDDVLLKCRAKRITISAIALKTNDLGPKVLERLTMAIKGQYLEAVNTVELGVRFAEAARLFHRRRYRLVLDIAANPGHAGQDSMEIRVKVGRGEGVVATERVR